MQRKKTLLLKNFLVALGVLLVWRGLWYVLDGIDLYLFKGSHVLTALGGIVVGIAILYLPDHDLKELGKL